MERCFAGVSRIPPRSGSQTLDPVFSGHEHGGAALSTGGKVEKAKREADMHAHEMRTGICFDVAECWLGRVLAAMTGQQLCAVFLGDDPGVLTCHLRVCFPRAGLTRDRAACKEIMTGVVEAVEHPGRGPSLPLAVNGTAFQLRVWRELMEISPGETATYTEIARRLGAPSAARAVGRACAANKLAVVVPCHRAVRTDGGLAGYLWGVERKRALLERERNFHASGIQV